MKKNVSLPLIITCLAFSLVLASAVWGVTFAAPMPPRLVVNHQTRQCAEIVPGDECGDVVLPPDWEYLEPTEGVKCPDDYTLVEFYPDWVHFKVSHCCTEGHSGVSGDCQDVVIQQSKRQCAFVDDIEKCTSLPDKWEAWGQNCPAEFEWTDDIACTEAETATTDVPATLLPTETKLPAEQTSIPTPTETEPATSKPLLPCLSPGLILAALLGWRFYTRLLTITP